MIQRAFEELLGVELSGILFFIGAILFFIWGFVMIIKFATG